MDKKTMFMSNIDALRIAFGLKKNYLYETLEVKRQTMYNWEKCPEKVDTRTWFAFMYLFEHLADTESKKKLINEACNRKLIIEPDPKYIHPKWILKICKVR